MSEPIIRATIPVQIRHRSRPDDVIETVIALSDKDLADLNLDDEDDIYSVAREVTDDGISFSFGDVEWRS